MRCERQARQDFARSELERRVGEVVYDRFGVPAKMQGAAAVLRIEVLFSGFRGWGASKLRFCPDFRGSVSIGFQWYTISFIRVSVVHHTFH